MARGVEVRIVRGAAIKDHLEPDVELLVVHLACQCGVASPDGEREDPGMVREMFDTGIDERLDPFGRIVDEGEVHRMGQRRLWRMGRVGFGHVEVQGARVSARRSSVAKRRKRSVGARSLSGR